MTTTFVGRAGTFFGGRLDDPPVSESQPPEATRRTEDSEGQ